MPRVSVALLVCILCGECWSKLIFALKKAKTSARLLTIESWYLENHPFLMSVGRLG